MRSSGDLSLNKSKSPAGNTVPGQSTPFTLALQLGAGADDLPAGASITIVDQLPGTATDYTIASINSGIASCNSVASANSSRTLTCTVSGPRTSAALNALNIVLTGSPGTIGNFTNVGTVQADPGGQYFDRDPSNNTASVNYQVDPGGDVQAQGTFPATPVATGSTQTLRLSWRNNGPTAMPAGGTISTTVPAGFTVSSLPAGCTGPAIGVPLAVPTALTCTADAVAVSTAQHFDIGLLMPAVAGSGNFDITVAPPAGYGDSNPANNSTSLPWQVVPAYADLLIGKSKSPASGPIAPGSTITTTLTVRNSAASSDTAVYSGLGGGTELRVVDYLRPTEIQGDTLSNITPAGEWTCTVSNNADPADATRTKRVECIRSNGGSLAPGAALTVSFGTVVAPVSGQVPLPNRACTGETLLSQLGLSPAQGPQPPGRGAGITDGNDCVVVANELIATDVTSGSGGVAIVKESSNDGSTWVDSPATPPVLGPEAPLQHWRITVTTPSGGGQSAIPTLRLADPLPGILNVPSPGAPAPGYVTPAFIVGTSVTTGAATGTCPNVAAGANQLNCTFTAVQPGTTIVITYAVARPFGAGLLSNTATLSSPDAILSGILSDAAALQAAPRIDVAATGKTVSPAMPRIGQNVLFTVTAQNYGPDDVSTAGEFKLIDDLNTSTAGALVAFGDISVNAANMSCQLATSALPDEAPLAADHVRVRCVNTTAVVRYAVRTMQISARVLKPAAMPGAGNVYSGQSNTARVDVPDARCEFKTETGSGPAVSATCNDAAATSNNASTVNFDVQVPQIDLQQRKTRVLPAGQTSFGIGQPLRYRFRLQNNGPSRAEGVVMTDRLTVPAGFTLHTPVVHNVNGVAAEGGYTLDSGKTGTVSCTQAAANADLVCVLAATPAASFLDANREVNFEVEFQQTGDALTTVTFGNQALICGDETAGYESAGACDRAALNNNNVASVNDVVFPLTDLALAKSTVTPSPVGINQPVEYRLQASNRGPSATQQIRITDTLPAGFELITAGAQAPSVVLGAAVTAAPSTATGAVLVCTPVPATVTLPNQQQVVTCVVDATPGPLGAGAFPGSTAAGNTVTVRLFARAKEGVYAGPYLNDRINNASISPGLDGGGNPLSIDAVPANNNSSSVVQVARSSLAGRVFVDRNSNGVQDGTLPAEDEGLGSVTLTLTGTDLYGNPISRTQTTNNTVGATRGDYLFDNLPPGNYTVTEAQPANYGNSPGTPPAASAGGTYAALGGPGTSTWSAVALPLNTTASGYNFPEVGPLTGIRGVVFSDRGDNAALDPGDAGLPGVTLVLGPPGYVCPVGAPPYAGALETVVTDANGEYHFASAASGNNYVVCQIQPAGYDDRPPLPGTNGSTPGANRIEITNLPALGSANNNFPEVLGRISGRVFFDHNPATPGSNNNGLQDAGEPGIGSNTPGAGVPITRTVYTAADGSYTFEDLLPGSYTVTQGAIPPALGSYSDGRNTAGTVTSGAPGTAGGVGDNRIHNIALNAGARSPDNNFAELPPVAVVVPVISGTVFIDQNRDGQFDSADTGRIGGVVVRLVEGGTCSGPEIGRTSTEADCSYRFPGGTVGAATLAAGRSYSICQEQPAGWGEGPTLPGSGNTSPGGNHIAVPALPATGSANNNFGEVSGLISGQVFLDRGDNGVFDQGDAGLADVIVVLGPPGYVCPSGVPPYAGALEATVTDAAGHYQFGNVMPGAGYVICQIQPAGYGDRSPAPGNQGRVGGTNRIEITSLPVRGSLGNNFPEVLGRISGKVFLDHNPATPGSRDNGVQDAGEPGIGSNTPGAGVPITLTGLPTAGPGAGVPVIRTVYTAADGSYVFEGLSPGSYTVTQGAIPPALGAYSEGRNTAGPVTSGTPGAAGAVDDSVIRNIGLDAGARSPGNNFAELPVAPVPVISGIVFIDRNRDGLLDVADPGRIGGVVLRLVEGDSCAGREIGRTVTEADGSYQFPGGSVAADALKAGRSYSLCQEQPVAWGDGPTLPGAGNNSPGTNHIRVPALLADGSPNNNFGELGGRIAGQVFLDHGNDGVRDGADFGIEGVGVQLHGGPAGVTINGTTRPDGSFVFEDLPAGNWDLVEQVAQPVVTIGGVPVATVDGRSTAGTGGGVASPVGAAPSRIDGITLAPGGEAVNNLFAETLGINLQVGKTTQEARFIVGRPGHYRIEVRNGGAAATDGSVYTVSDHLPAGVTLASLPSGAGWTCTAAVGGSRFSCSRSDVLPAGASAPAIEFAVAVGTAAADASPVHNAALVEGGGEPPARQPGAEPRGQFENNPGGLPLCTLPPSHDVCRATTPVVLPAALSGTVWLETGGSDRQLGPDDRRLEGWIVELIDPATGRVVATAVTGPDGRYRITDIEPGVPYGVRFRDPDSGVIRSGPVNGDHGSPIAHCEASAPPSSCGSGVRQPMLTVVLAPGQELVEQSLPVDPSGVVYDAVTRDPVPGAVVSLTPVGSCPAWDPAQHVAGATLGGYAIDGSSIRMTSGSGGYYFFDLLPSAPGRCLFALTVQPPPSHGFVSELIPPQPGALLPTGPLGSNVAVQPQPVPPTGAPGPATTYYLQLDLGSTTPGVVNNHIPLDPAAPAGLMLRKTGDKAVAELGDSVRYSITVSVAAGASARHVTVADRLPAGFTFIAGTAFVNGQRVAEPAGAPGPQLAFEIGGVPAGGSVTLQYRVRVGVGATEGDGINVAVAHGCSAGTSCVQPGTLQPLPRARSSNEGRYRVRVSGGVFSVEACVLGKVYVDCNGNHVQDREELGIPGVRLVLQDGTFLTSDSEGKYSMCGLPPKSHVLRIDESTLPRGSRLTTSSNRNLGDAGSLWLDLKNGEIHRADFIEGSCANPVLDQVKARRALGEITAPQVEKRGRPALRFDSKAHGLSTLTAPAQGTDSANQQAPKQRPASSGRGAAEDDRTVPTPEQPMNRPPPPGRTSADAPDAAPTRNQGGSHGTR